MTCTPECKKPSHTQAHCALCHLTFSGVTAFDKHRKAGVCTSPQAMGLTNRDGVWGGAPMNDARLQSLKNLRERK